MMKFSRLKIINRLRTSCAAAKSGGMGFVFKKFIVCAGILTAHNKAYALHSLAFVRATPHLPLTVVKNFLIYLDSFNIKFSV